MTVATPNDLLLPLADIRSLRRDIAAHIQTTPVWDWMGPTADAIRPVGGSVVCKLELLQVTGSFKPRGALAVMRALTPEELRRGVVAVSTGNHAIAVAYAARTMGVSAKVVIPRTANPARVAACQAYGGDVIFVDTIQAAYEVAQRMASEEGRALVHPFEGKWTAMGTATLGVEFIEQVPDLDAVIVPIGGGGLCAGVAAAVKQLRPQCAVYGVEPMGADSMWRSFQAGHAVAIDRVATIADSLGAPRAGVYTYALCRKYVDDIVRVDDTQLLAAMRSLFFGLKLAVEPAAASAVAAVAGPLRDRLADQRVGVIVCGSNIDPETYASYVLETVA